MMNPSGPVVWLSLAVVVASVSAAVPVNTKTMKNFGHSIKNGLRHTCCNPLSANGPNGTVFPLVVNCDV
jgi:hypothetical protein